MGTVKWVSREGIVVEFWANPPNVRWSDQPGIYMFCLFNGQANKYEPVYIGQCNSFATRMCGHERWPEAVRSGATHVLAAHVPTQADRDKLEQILIQQLGPRLNTMLRR